MVLSDCIKNYNLLGVAFSKTISREDVRLLHENFYKDLIEEQFYLACKNACKDYEFFPSVNQILLEYNLLIPKFQKQEKQKEGVPMPEECKKKMDKIKLKKVEDL